MPSPSNPRSAHPAGTSSQSDDASDQSSALLSQSPPAAPSAPPMGNAAGVDGGATHICRKSYAATTLTRPSFNTTGAEWNSARKRSPNDNAGRGSAAAAAPEDSAMTFDEGDNNAAGGSAKTKGRWLHRDATKHYAASKNDAASPPPASSNKKQGKARRAHPLRAKLARQRAMEQQREEGRSSASPSGGKGSRASDGKASPLDTDKDGDDDGDVDDEEVDQDAPAQFRASYETKNASHPKNMERIDAIARDQEFALLAASFVEVPCEDEAEEMGGGFSPLTCPPSQPAWGQRRMVDEEEEEVDFGGGGGFEEERAEGGALGQSAPDEEEAANKPPPKEPEATGGTTATAKAKADEPGDGSGTSEGEYKTDDQESEESSDDDESELPSPFHGRKPASKPAAGGRPPLPPIQEAKKRVGRGKGVLALALEVEYDEPETRVACNDQGHGDAADPHGATKKLRRGKGATALALAAEYDAPEEKSDASDKDDEEDPAKKGTKRRKGATALALAEYEATGEVDSYFDREAATRKAVLSKKHAETEGRTFFRDEEGGHASFRCEDDAEPVGTEKQSEPLLGTERQSEPLLGTEKQSEPLLGTERQSEPLLGTEKQSSEPLNGTEKQSEPLLSSSGADPSSSAADGGAAVNGASASDNPNGSRTADEMLTAVYDELHEMGRALTCSICQGTLRKAKILPCIHAFCSGCLKDYFCPTPVAAPTNKRKKKVSPRKLKNECPKCRAHIPGRRAGVEAPHLDELVRAYKMTQREFGFAPKQYAPGIVMTQIGPGEGASYEDGESDEGEDGKPPAMGTNDARKDFEDHLQLSRIVQGAFRRSEESVLQHKPATRGEEMALRKKLQRRQMLRQEQDAVVQANEEIFHRKFRRMGGAKEMVAAETANFFAQASSSNAFEGEKQSDKNDSSTSKRNEEVAESETTALPDSATAAAGNVSSNLGAKKSGIDVDAVATNQTKPGEGATEVEIEKKGQPAKNTTAEQPVDESTMEEEQFCTAPDGSQSIDYSTAREESQGTSSLLNTTATSHTMIHDGNTAKKADRPDLARASSASGRGSNVLDVETSPEAKRVAERESMAAGAAAKQTRRSVATAASEGSPIVLHDGNTIRKDRRGARSSNTDMSLLESNLDDDPTPRRSGKMSPLPAATLALERAAAGDGPAVLDSSADAIGDSKLCAPKVADAASAPAAKQQIAKGTIVVVQARTWPGINKPGGVGRVTKVHIDGVNSSKYDVAYVLGGKEKNVDESFVSLHEPDPLPTIEERPASARSTRGSRSAEKKARSVRPRKAAAKPEPKSSAASSVPIYNDEELKHIPADVLQWAGIVPKEKKGKSKADGGKKETARGKKRALKESNGNSKSKQAKKRKASSKREASVKDGDETSEKDQPLTEQSLPLIISGLATNKEIVDLADARYSSLLSLDEKSSKSDTLTLYAVTSSLTDKDSEVLDSLCKMLKGNNVILKITKDFNANKTQLCLTAAASPSKTTSTQPNEAVDVVSKSRTLKVMRSALSGIPILTPLWMESCLKEGRLVAPSGIMCIRTLPRKQASTDESLPSEQFGAAKYAAAYHKASPSTSNHLLSGVAVMLCGNSAGSGMVKDLKVLLQQAGASIVSSVSMATRQLTNISKGESGQLVFLCDDSATDQSCGISDALFKHAKKLVSEAGSEVAENILCVHRNWLFDSISCATPMKPAAYEPLAPRAKALWDLTTPHGTFVSGGNKYESQAY